MMSVSQKSVDYNEAFTNLVKEMELVICENEIWLRFP